MTERRYTDAEVAEIFRIAADDTQARQLPAPREEAGLTLAALQEIGREAGMEPEAVARAAQALDVRPQPAPRTLLGLPIAVGRTVHLNRWLTDAEWELLVVELREVFNARGTVKSHGTFREWRNGNLQALLEPTPTGHRLRLKTLKGNAQASILGGLAMIGMTAVMGIAGVVTGDVREFIGVMTILGATGTALLASGAIQVPGWARLRGRQMEDIASRIAAPSAGGALPPVPQD